MHRAWIPAVLIVVTSAFVPRALDATARNARIGRIAGTFGSDGAPQNEFGDSRFRWMKRVAALQEPVYGTRLQVPLFVGRPGIEGQALRLRVTVSGRSGPSLTLRQPGWVTLDLDLISLMGENEWRTAPSVRIAFHFEPADPSAAFEMGHPGVGLAQAHWSGPSPR